MPKREWPIWLPDMIRFALETYEQSAVSSSSSSSEEFFKIRCAAKNLQLQIEFLHEALTAKVPVFDSVAWGFACVQEAQKALSQACKEEWEKAMRNDEELGKVRTSKSSQVRSNQGKVA